MNKKELALGRLGCIFAICFSFLRAFGRGFAGDSDAWFTTLEIPFFMAVFGLFLYGFHNMSTKYSLAGAIISLLNAIYLFVDEINLNASGWNDLLNLFLLIGLLFTLCLFGYLYLFK
ncbi:hypothetical protein [Bacillus cereus]|uniref:Uncharacterized protein n=1 Tax=Bacillus cereus TaxID=1396 RepID=A0A9X7QN94_BACCE|nr:hypothetical protein [Bacillus cereus]QDZ76722.1 hypothetical protein D0437_28240 [Bacillus cereus]